MAFQYEVAHFIRRFLHHSPFAAQAQPLIPIAAVRLWTSDIRLYTCASLRHPEKLGIMGETTGNKNGSSCAVAGLPPCHKCAILMA